MATAAARVTVAVAVAVAGVLTTACASARMRVDPELARASQGWEVEGANPRTWGAEVRFGPYRTVAVEDRTTSGWSAPVLGATLARDDTPYAWRMVGGAAAVDAECHELRLEIRTASAAADLRGASRRPALACAFRASEPAGGSRTWTLSLTATGSTSSGYRGTLRDGATGAEYEVASSHDLERSRLRLGTPAGYLVSRGDDLVAMFETLGRGRVWMARTAADRDALAAAGMALLLFRPPE
jgi:hypothetical protein